MFYSQRITYKVENCTFIPYCTGVIVMENLSRDEYEDAFDKNVQNIINSNTFEGDNCFVDSFDDLGLYSYDYSFLADGQHIVYRFFNIECENDMYAVFTVSSGTPMKLWINYNLYSFFGAQKKVCIVALRKGINCIVMETYKATKKSTIFLRVSDYYWETKKETYDSLFCENMYPISNFGYVKHSGNHLYNINNVFEFAFFPENDIDSIKNDAKIEISDALCNKVYYYANFEIRKKQRIDLSEIDIPSEDDGNTFCAKIKYIYSNGNEFNTAIPLYKKRTDERLGRLSQKTLGLLKSSKLTEYDKLALMQGYEYINMYGRELPAILAQATLLRNNVKYVQDGNHLDNIIFTSGEKKVFFYNKMYNAVNYYWMYVPEEYSDKKKYPLIVILSTLEYNDRSKFFENYTNEDVLVVDVSMRGMTLGSYIGEAAIQCALDDILNKFSVDIDRIYCTGISNGAGGAWAQLEMFPDRYAGGYIVSGNLNLSYLCNINNDGLILLASKADYLNKTAFELPMIQLKDHCSCLPIVVNNLTHQLLELVWFKKPLFDLLLNFRRNPFPPHIIYKTMSNRHTKAYWIDIHSIEYGQVEGKIEADIKEREIRIECAGITGFTICTPPQVSGNSFSVIVNGKKIACFEDGASGFLYFTQNTHSDFYYMNSFEVKRETRKGFGLLDVFLDPLSIVKPDNASNNELNTVTTYSEPYCNGIIPKIYIKYPVVNYSELEAGIEKSDRSYVVLDNGEDNLLLKIIREKAIVLCGKRGWKYKGEEYNGKYCVQQIVESPWNPERSIHLISYNDENMLNKNIFTRKLVIPSYVNGRHKYLNNMALIFDENGYSCIMDNTCGIDKL